jgi:hypothetical protein
MACLQRSGAKCNRLNGCGLPNHAVPRRNEQKWTEGQRTDRLDQRTSGELALERKQLHQIAAATPSRWEPESVIPAENQREIPFALPIVTINFLYMGARF